MIRAPHHIAALVAACFAIAAVQACAQSEPATSPTAPTFYDYEIVNTYPHDTDAFTQGLFFDDGLLFESTGQFGQSSLREVELTTGEVVRATDLAPEIFGEGSTSWNGKIITLSWQSGKGFIFDRDSFKQTASFSYDGEGWGLTHDGKRLIMSDGTPVLRFLDPITLKQTDTLNVTIRGKALPHINELEWVNGEIFANIWMTEAIARIDPETGIVTGIIDMRGLLSADEVIPRKTDVLNGIAYDKEANRLFVTGKNWPKLFEITLKERIKN